MTDPCIKTLPKRIEKQHKYKICKCNHGNFEHRWKLVGFWTSGIKYMSCKECICEEYNEIGKFTWEEWQKLKECEE